MTMAGKKRYRLANSDAAEVNPQISKNSKAIDQDGGTSSDGPKPKANDDVVQEVGSRPGGHLKKKRKKRKSLKRKRGAFESESFSEIRVHRCGFIPWRPPGILCIGLNPVRPLVAVAREGGLVELRSTSLRYAAVATITVTSRVTSAIFAPDGRTLIISTLGGNIMLYNCLENGLDLKCVISPGGGAIWDTKLDLFGEKLRIIIACEDGKIRFITRENALTSNSSPTYLPDNLSQYIVNAGAPGRCRALSVSLSPSPDGPLAVCDARGYISFLDRNTGVTSRTCSIPERCPIWCSTFVQNGSQLITGDARGVITIWDVLTATIRESLTLENTGGAIRTLSTTGICTNRLEYVGVGFASGSVGFLVCSGAPDGSRGRAALWRPIRGTGIFDGDVSSSLIQRIGREPGSVSANRLRFVFGSNDSRIMAFRVNTVGGSRFSYKVYPFTSGPGVPLPVQVVQLGEDASSSGVIVARHLRHVDLWNIYAGSDRLPQLVLRLKLCGLGGDVTCCSVNFDGTRIAVAGPSCIRILKVEHLRLRSVKQSVIKNMSLEQKRDGVSSVPRVHPLHSITSEESNSPEVAAGPSRVLCFIGTRRLAALSANGRVIRLIDIESRTNRTLLTSSSFVPPAERFCMMSSSRTHFAVTDACKRLYVASASGEQNSTILAKSAITALRFNHTGERMVAITADFTAHTLSLLADRGWTHKCVKLEHSLNSPPTGLDFCGSALLLHGHDYAQLSAFEHGEGTGQFSPQSEVFARKEIEGLTNVIGAGVVEGEVFIVHQPKELVSEQLPMVISKKRFGF